MCGITGILKKDGSNVSRDVLLAMRDTMTHRGPDDAGVWIDGSVGLAHRRLSILDPSPGGHQPMSDPTGDVWVVYNGELYNYPALRKLCEARGVALRSHSDTETILHLWRFFGERMVDHMRGMFAFGLVGSAPTGSLSCARSFRPETTVLCRPPRSIPVRIGTEGPPCRSGVSTYPRPACAPGLLRGWLCTRPGNNLSDRPQVATRTSPTSAIGWGNCRIAAPVLEVRVPGRSLGIAGRVERAD